MLSNDYVLHPPSWLLRDGLEPDEHELAALVASGDCFVTIATQLDELTQIADLPDAARVRIETITRVLLYMQRHYAVAKKQSDYRQ